MRKSIVLMCLALSLAVLTAREAKADIPYDMTQFPFTGVASTATYLYDDGANTYGYTVLTAATAGTLGVDPGTMMPVFKPYVFVFICWIGPTTTDPTLVPSGTTTGPPPTAYTPQPYNNYWYVPPFPGFPGLHFYDVLSNPWM